MNRRFFMRLPTGVVDKPAGWHGTGEDGGVEAGSRVPSRTERTRGVGLGIDSTVAPPAVFWSILGDDDGSLERAV